jgi:hypothetical protein
MCRLAITMNLSYCIVNNLYINMKCGTSFDRLAWALAIHPKKSVTATPVLSARLRHLQVGSERPPREAQDQSGYAGLRLNVSQ